MEAAGNSSEDLPEWLEDFTENLEIVEMPAAANISHDSDPGTSYKSGTKEAQYFSHGGIQHQQEVRV